MVCSSWCNPDTFFDFSKSRSIRESHSLNWQGGSKSDDSSPILVFTRHCAWPRWVTEAAQTWRSRRKCPHSTGKQTPTWTQSLLHKSEVKGPCLTIREMIIPVIRAYTRHVDSGEQPVHVKNRVTWKQFVFQWKFSVFFQEPQWELNKVIKKIRSSKNLLLLQDINWVTTWIW